MPTAFVVGVAIVLFLGTFAALAFLLTVWFEWRDEKQNPVLGWDDQPTLVLASWNAEDRKERERCPDCKGTRCWDWRHNGRGCKENPTEADGSNDYLVGRHNRFNMVPVGRNWWPTPKSRFARTRPDLWKRVAGHCQIALYGPVRTLA